MPKIVIDKYEGTAEYFIEDLGNEIKLEMIVIPGGNFMMGSPTSEENSSDNERPQHRVTIKPFLIGMHQITQAQWRAVTSWQKVNRDLDPDPYIFKGANLPVENISWNEAVEFCDRLSKYTKRKYRLPSEAEWEYACRAGTTTPFHFGETITTDLANYRGTDDKKYKLPGSYGQGPKGIYREKTTEVGSFKAANNFGLYDMHGNVWEWCQDMWHNNYKEAPTDGSAWINKNENDNQFRVLRGGSWSDLPDYCRSADRDGLAPAYRDINIGFRVVLVGVARILH